MSTTTLTAPVATDAARSDARPLVDRIPGWALLLAGAAAILLTSPRWGIAALAWLAPVPLLLYARRIRGWRGWLALGGVLIVAHPIQLLSIATAPIPPLAMIPFGVPRGLLVLLALLIAEQLRRRTGEAIGVFAFASATVLLDWIGYRHTEFGQWVATGNGQVDVLPLLQLAAITGIAGLGFLIAWVAAALASLLASPPPLRRWRHLLIAAAVSAAAMLYGSLRLDHTGGRTVRVAAVVTDLGLSRAGIPDARARADNDDALFARTRAAAARGARLVVWNEVATLVEIGDEGALLERGRAVARELGVDLVLAYGVLLSHRPLLLDNKYAFITSDGDIADSYSKQHPVPGAEPSQPGHGPLHVIDRPYARVGGAICYDYDFPAMGLEHAERGAELVVVPSSDWRGIDPVHTQMARVRAIEGGFSLVRSTRWGASAGFDAYGRVRGWMQTTEANDRVMVTDVPIGRIHTVYSAIGDTPVAAAGGFLLVAAGLAVRRRRRDRLASPGDRGSFAP